MTFDHPRFANSCIHDCAADIVAWNHPSASGICVFRKGLVFGPHGDRMVNPPSWSDLFPAISEFLGAAKGRHEQTALLLRVQVVLLFLSLVVLVFIAYRVT